MPTLVVVDMQTHFKASQTGWMIEHVSREIRASMQAGHAIVFLEYTRNAGPAGVAAAWLLGAGRLVGRACNPRLGLAGESRLKRHR